MRQTVTRSSRRHVTVWLMVLWFLIVCWLVAALPVTLQAERWREKKGRHFRVFYMGDAGFAADVINHAEYYYTRINVDLGLNHVVKRHRILWLWDKRCRIYLYRNRQEYVEATGAPTWSGAVVEYRERLISSFTGSDRFLTRTLPHELAHILFREYVGFGNHRVPRWLDEGVAQYAETGRRDEALEFMQRCVAQGIYIPLERINRLAVNRLGGSTAGLFYTQAVTLVDFLLTRYGSERFMHFCGNLREGYSIERALGFATSGSVSSMSELEDAWRSWLVELSS